MTETERFNKVIDYVLNTYPKITNQKELSDALGVNHKSVNGASTGRLKVAKSIWLAVIEKFPELSEEWVMFGRGNMMRSDRSDGVRIPILSHLRASLDEYVVIPDFAKLGCDYMLRMGGDSMVPYASNGDLVACRKLGRVSFYQFGKVYVLDTEQGLLVKVVQKADDPKRITLHSFNPCYEDFTVDMSDIREVSMVLGTVRME